MLNHVVGWQSCILVLVGERAVLVAELSFRLCGFVGHDRVLSVQALSGFAGTCVGFPAMMYCS